MYGTYTPNLGPFGAGPYLVMHLPIYVFSENSEPLYGPASWCRSGLLDNASESFSDPFLYSISNVGSPLSVTPMNGDIISDHKANLLAVSAFTF